MHNLSLWETTGLYGIRSKALKKKNVELAINLFFTMSIKTRSVDLDTKQDLKILKNYL